MSIDPHSSPIPLHNASAEVDALSLDAAAEAAWVDVVHQMEEVYSDLIKYQVEIEKKNQALEDAQHFIDNVLTTMTDVLIVTDTQGRIRQVNRALEQALGVAEAELLGRAYLDLFSADSRRQIENFRRQGGELAFRDRELHLTLGRGAETPLSMNCASRHDARGRVLGLVLIGRPLGELQKAYLELNNSHQELQRAQQQLIDSEKMASLGRLVAGVAHELNNPISFVYGNVHSLIRYCQRLEQYLGAVHGDAPQPEQDELRRSLRIDRLLNDLPSLLEGTMEGAERVRDIVMDLRQFSSGQKESKCPFDLVHVIRTAVHWVTRDAGIKLRLAYDLPQTCEIYGHPGQIQQVLINLVQNALDALAAVEVPRLALSLRCEEARVRFEIHDNGRGIAEDNLSKLFEPFFTTKPVGQGTGLGLSLSYGLIKEHGGTLSAFNHPGGGACFVVELPRGPVEERP
ncbi:sensor histidine kinase [Motiliproteus sp. SC1-56]|uniref:sensor histidine kinase n=1 Tax=Motiliproteus sp. SC1-56 TaxID=2799565 RepID=UPI001A8EEFF0|nr:ATP-binding protein [Motiliproteus sp. SC1-56]